MQTSQINLLKLATNVVASASVWKVVNDVIRHNVSVQTTADQVKVWTGSMIIGSMVADQASQHVNKNFDKAVEWLENRRFQVKVEEKPANQQ
jgi:hypothetical protein